MNFFEREIEKLVDYFKTTPVLLILFEFFSPLLSGIGTIYGYISSNITILLSAFILVVLFFIIRIYTIKRNYINIKSLYLNDETFLSHMITNITEVRRLKRKEKINNVSVEALNMTFTIEPTLNNSTQSDMQVTWIIRGKTSDNELLNYHLLCSKSESKRNFNPIIEIREFTNTYIAGLTNKTSQSFHINL